MPLRQGSTVRRVVWPAQRNNMKQQRFHLQLQTKAMSLWSLETTPNSQDLNSQTHQKYPKITWNHQNSKPWLCNQKPQKPVETLPFSSHLPPPVWRSMVPHQSPRHSRDRRAVSLQPPRSSGSTLLKWFWMVLKHFETKLKMHMVWRCFEDVSGEFCGFPGSGQCLGWQHSLPSKITTRSPGGWRCHIKEHLQVQETLWRLPQKQPR